MKTMDVACPHCGSHEFTQQVIQKTAVRIRDGRVVLSGRICPNWVGFMCRKCKIILPSELSPIKIGCGAEPAMPQALN
jgi:RNA polymerase subunit RPABC4/transcription elongation factor Spt4